MVLFTLITLAVSLTASLSAPACSADVPGVDADSGASLSLLQFGAHRAHARQSAVLDAQSGTRAALADRMAQAACGSARGGDCARAAVGVAERLLASAPADCDLCGGDQQWLFVLAGGRSGSTTVLSMLNAIPGFHIAGENWGAMNSILELWKSANSTGFGHSPEDKIEAWSHTEISEKRVLCAMQDYVRVIVGEFDTANTKVIGFKEIRHKTPEQLSFFGKVFPCARYVINTRDVEEQHKSGWFKAMPVEKLEAKKLSLESFSSAHNDTAFDLPLESFGVKRFNSMLHWLGVSNCSFTQVAHANDGGYAARVGPSLNGSCQYHPVVPAAGNSSERS